MTLLLVSDFHSHSRSYIRSLTFVSLLVLSFTVIACKPKENEAGDDGMATANSLTPDELAQRAFQNQLAATQLNNDAIDRAAGRANDADRIKLETAANNERNLLEAQSKADDKEARMHAEEEETKREAMRNSLINKLGPDLIRSGGRVGEEWIKAGADQTAADAQVANAKANEAYQRTRGTADLLNAKANQRRADADYVRAVGSMGQDERAEILQGAAASTQNMVGKLSQMKGENEEIRQAINYLKASPERREELMTVNPRLYQRVQGMEHQLSELEKAGKSRDDVINTWTTALDANEERIEELGTRAYSLGQETMNTSIKNPQAVARVAGNADSLTQEVSEFEQQFNTFKSVVQPKKKGGALSQKPPVDEKNPYEHFVGLDKNGNFVGTIQGMDAASYQNYRDTLTTWADDQTIDQSPKANLLQEIERREAALAQLKTQLAGNSAFSKYLQGTDYLQKKMSAYKNEIASASDDKAAQEKFKQARDDFRNTRNYGMANGQRIVLDSSAVTDEWDFSPYTGGSYSLTYGGPAEQFSPDVGRGFGGGGYDPFAPCVLIEGRCT